jgi:MFS family permease
VGFAPLHDGFRGHHPPVTAALLVPAGRFADLVGRRRVFFAGIATFLLASALCAAAPSVEVLVAARVLQAVGAAMLVPTSLGLLLPEFPSSSARRRRRSGARRAPSRPRPGRRSAASSSMSPTGAGSSVNLPIGLAAIVPARRLLVETRNPVGGAVPDLVGVGLLTVGVGLLALGIVEGPEWGWGGADVLGALAAGALLLGLFVVRSRTAAAPAVDLDLFRVRSLAVANAAMVVYAMAFYALLLCNVLFLTSVWGYDVLQAGVALTPAPLMAAVAAPIGGGCATGTATGSWPSRGSCCSPRARCSTPDDGRLAGVADRIPARGRPRDQRARRRPRNAGAGGGGRRVPDGLAADGRRGPDRRGHRDAARPAPRAGPGGAAGHIGCAVGRMRISFTSTRGGWETA